MNGEVHPCSLHDEAGTVIESTNCTVNGHPGITDWGGTVGPTDVELSFGVPYRLRLADGRDGLIVIERKLRAGAAMTGNRYVFTGRGTID